MQRLAEDDILDQRVLDGVTYKSPHIGRIDGGVRFYRNVLP